MLLATNFVAKAQDMPIFGQNYINRFSINPAFAGFNGNIETFLGCRQTNVGIEGNPKTLSFDFNGAANENMGYGISVLSQKSGNFNNLFAAITYAYHIKMSDDMSLSLALSPALVRNSFNIGGVTTYGNAVDPVLQNQAGLSSTGFDAGFGLMFNWTNLYVSVSSPRLICKDLDFNPAIYNYDRTINSEISYNIIANKFEIEPSVGLWYGMENGLDFRAGVAAKYSQRIWAAISYFSQGYVGVGVGVAAGSRIVVNYQYETGTTDLAKTVNGTHELSVGFLVSRAKKRKLPTAFAEDETAVKPEDDKKENKLLQETIKKLEKEVDERKDEIERLEKMIKALPQNNQTGSNNNTPNNVNNQQQTAENQQNNQQQNQQNQQNQSQVNQPNPDQNVVADEEFQGEPNLNWSAPRAMWNVTFGYGSSKIQTSTRIALQSCIRAMKDIKNVQKIKIIAHYDAIGSVKYNREVAVQRADAIINFLKTNGLNVEIIKEIKFSTSTSNYAERLAQNMFEYSYL